MIFTQSYDQTDKVMSMFGDIDIEIVDSTQKVKIPKITMEHEEVVLEEGEKDPQAMKVLGIIEEINKFDQRIEEIQTVLEPGTLVAEERERLQAEHSELKVKIAELLKSLRLKDRHIEKIAQRLKELSCKVDLVMQEIVEMEKETGTDKDLFLATFDGLTGATEAKFAKKLNLSQGEAHKLENRYRSIEKKLQKIEQEAGFKSRELSGALLAIEEGERKAKLAKSELVEANLSEQTSRVLSTLTPREEKVLRMRFGIGEKKDHTLEEVGKERIRRIELKALRKLRQPSRSRELKIFVE